MNVWNASTSLLISFLTLFICLKASNIPQDRNDQWFLDVYLENLAAVSDHIQAGVDINQCDQSGYTALEYSIINGNYELAKLLLDAPNINLEDNTLLHLAVHYDRVAIVPELMNKLSDVNYKDSSRNAPIHKAAWNGNVEMLHALNVDERIDLNIGDGLGQTPLHLAVKRNKVDFVRGLIDYRADLVKTNNLYQTPLDYCANKLSHKECAELLEAGIFDQTTFIGK